MAIPPRPHPLARSKVARWANRAVELLWDKGITPKPPLEPDYLWKVGSKGFEITDETSIRTESEIADFRNRLERLCRSLREEARLNPLGHTLAYGQLTAAIRKRHALGRYWRWHPDVAATAICDPIIVIGQMRAGTTRVHRLFAADPRHAGTRFCNSHDPVPSSPDLRPLKSGVALAIARQINPWLDAIHPFGATRIDEEIGWLAGALSPATFEAQWHIPGYVAWSEAQDPAPLYTEFARILRTDAFAMGNAGKPRVLKCPQFSEDLPALLDRFPGARLVIAERSDSAVLTSSISLVSSQMAFQSDEADLQRIEAEWKRKLNLRNKRMATALDQTLRDVVSIDFADLGRDWQAVMSQAYASLGLTLTPEALAAMMREQEKAAKGAHSSHRTHILEFQGT